MMSEEDKKIIKYINKNKLESNTAYRDPVSGRFYITDSKGKFKNFTTEEEVISYLNEQSNRKFKPVEDEYCRYDAEDDEYIVEIKVRKKHYQDCLIEYDKFDNNISTSDSLGKDFLYVVATSEDIYVFNCTKLSKKNFKIIIKLL